MSKRRTIKRKAGKVEVEGGDKEEGRKTIKELKRIT